MTATVSAPPLWEMVVGLEVHVQLRTRTKAFCNCSAEYGAAPNANTCPICLALPGSLPVLNAQAVELASRAALALNCTLNLTSVFARKNYFYPDLPKGYQISQFDKPLAGKGRVRIGTTAEGAGITVGITRVHMEEDAGKSVHDRYSGATAIDLNRSGVPLIEIVSEPDMRSAEAAGAYLRVLKQILQYVGVSDCDMEKGSLRVDANVSARRAGDIKLGTKTEVKNLNSFSNVERALTLEFARQTALLERGGRVEQQTMLFDQVRNEVRPSRTKEGSHDYRYFPEPDLPPLVLAQDFLDRMKASLPELPEARRERFAKEYALGEYDVEVLTASAALADYFEGVARQSGDPKAAANWTINGVLAALNAGEDSLETFRVRPADLAALIKLVRDGIVGHSAAKQVFSEMVKTGDRPEQIAQREGLTRVEDDAALRAWIDEVLAEHPTEAQRYLAGEKKLQGVLVGFVMKKSKGSADAKKVNQLLASRAQG
ncbi:MAG TPA: Asp-tRNA(Asn)/Glu-tRNA(Gln) amidotransferase subunit GatB [Gemmatimonadaceae bacterium]|nr:Asp-tRNA(Asn)/Glu-tRNA(Gln) amidotransferase subunit GatB [Gemmatimonadaceae bacterium]